MSLRTSIKRETGAGQHWYIYEPGPGYADGIPPGEPDLEGEKPGWNFDAGRVDVCPGLRSAGSKNLTGRV